MKQLKCVVFPGICLAILFCIHAFIINNFVAVTPRVEIRAKEYNINSLSSVSSRELEQIQERNPAYTKEVSGYANNHQVNISIASYNADVYMNFKLVFGNFFTERATEVGLNVAVISEDLSFTLFNTTNGVGNVLQLNDIPYTVCGIYTQESLYTTLSSNGDESVYIPFNSSFDSRYASEAGLQNIFFMGDNDMMGTFAADNIYKDLQLISTNANNYKVNNYAHAYIIIRQFLLISVLILSILLCLRIIQCILAKLKKIHTFFSKFLPYKEINDVIQANSLWLLSQLVSILLLLIIAVIVLRLSLFDLYIPSQYIPDQSLLDFSFYKNIFVDYVREKNALYAYKPSPYEQYYLFMLIVSVKLTALELPFSIFLYKRTRLH